MIILGPVKRQRQKCADVLLDRDPADIEEDRARQLEIALLRRMEMDGIDASRPAAQILEAAGGELASDTRGRHHDTGRRTVEAALTRCLFSGWRPMREN